MLASVIAEGNYDVEILRRLLPPNLSSKAELLNGQGFDGVKSLARSIVAARRTPVAVVIDADTSDPELIKSRRQSMREMVVRAVNSVPVGVIVAVPELEFIFFEAPSVLTRLYPSATGDTRLLELARSNTRQALQTLDPGHDFDAIRRRLLAEIKGEDIPAFQQTKVIRELIDFLVGAQPRPVMIRVEIGPGMPSDLQPLKDRDGWKALLHALANAMTADTWSAEQVATGMSGGVVVQLHPTRFDIHMEPAGAIPTKFVMQVEGEAQVQQTEPQG